MIRTNVKSRIAYLLALLLSSSLLPQVSLAYTPHSPEVRDLIDKANEYLKSARGHKYVGGHCLIAMALYKSSEGEMSKVVRDALARCGREMTKDNLATKPHKTYSHAISLMFLCEVSPQRHRQTIEDMVDAIIAWQMPNGGWGYDNEELGDTSQTQYCVMALWEAEKIGVQVPQNVFIRACNWLMKVQDVSGGWPYKGKVQGNRRINQAHVYPSMAAAGLGSLYICADSLGLGHLSEKDNNKQVGLDDLPPVFRVVDVSAGARSKGDKKSVAGVDSTYVKRAMSDGNRWFRAKGVVPQTTSFSSNMIWNYYYLYAMERYKSFREIAESDKTKEPSWYNRGVEWLMEQQREDGAFLGDGSRNPNAGPMMTTSFAVLFLIRNTKKTIGQISTGALAGGKGIPDGALRRGSNGKIITSPISKQLGDLLALIEDEESEQDIEAMLKNAIFDFDSDKETAKEQIARLRDLVTHDRFDVRISAVQMLGRQRNLDNIPALIFALSDPDWKVVRAARDGLRFISRRLDGFGIPNGKDVSAAQRAILAWKQWYAGIRPDAIFFDE